MPVVTCVTATGELVTLHLPPGLHNPDMAAVVDKLLQVGYIMSKMNKVSKKRFSIKL